MLSIEKQIYLCKYHDIDKFLYYTLKISNKEAENMIKDLDKSGLYKKYRNLSEEEYEKMIERKKKK